jgi:hypothetical protein
MLALSMSACASGPDAGSILAPDERSAVTAQQPGNCAAQALTVLAATASSEQNNGYYKAGWAIDGNTSTRWSSNQGMPQWLQLDMGKVVFVGELDIDWQTAYATSFDVLASNDGTNFGKILSGGATQPGWQYLAGLNVTARYLRIQATGATSYGNVSIVETVVQGDANSACSATEASCGQSVKLVASSATASSTQFSYTPASAGIDQNYGTRWSSGFTDNEWLAIDLGGSARVDSLRIFWENAFASQYAIQTGTSITGPWTTAATMTDTKSGPQVVAAVNTTTRFLRVLGIKRATQYGYSLYEVEVYGSRDLACNNLLTGWNQSATTTDVPGAYSFDATNPNEIYIPGTASGCPGGPVYFRFTQNVNVPAGATFKLSLAITNVGGPDTAVQFAASLGSAAVTYAFPVSFFDGSAEVPAGGQSADGSIVATFAANSTAAQTLPLTIETVVPAISTGQSGCVVGLLQSFTLSNATLVKVN